MKEPMTPGHFRTLHCPLCPLYATCPQFSEQVDACIEALAIQQEEAAEAKQRLLLPMAEEE